MFFGKIDYLNLLPFHVYLKRSNLQSYIKKSIEFKKDVPSKLCKDLYNKRINSAIISSVESRHKRYKTTNLGIVSKKCVKSVLVRKNSIKSLDKASMTSNMLSKVLGANGEVLIGDRALKAYLSEGGDSEFYDLAKIWQDKFGYPFVFAVFCCNKDFKFYNKFSKNFLKQNVKIPRYILKNYSRSRGISEKDILWYLKFIDYKIDTKERKSLRIFLNKARALKFKP